MFLNENKKNKYLAQENERKVKEKVKLIKYAKNVFFIFFKQEEKGGKFKTKNVIYFFSVLKNKIQQPFALSACEFFYFFTFQSTVQH